MRSAWRRSLAGSSKSDLQPLSGVPDRIVPQALELEMVKLHQALASLLPHGCGKVIHFIGPNGGEGTSTIVGAFAEVGAMQAGRCVVSIDLASDNPAYRARVPVSRYRRAGAEGDEAEPSGSCLPAANLLRVEEGGLWVGEGEAWRQMLFDRPAMAAYWNRLRERADVIAIETPPLERSTIGLAIAPLADGVVLVIEADRTNEASIRRTLQDLERCGGRCLGMVLNKKRSYVPRMFDNWL